MEEHRRRHREAYLQRQRQRQVPSSSEEKNKDETEEEEQFFSKTAATSSPLPRQQQALQSLNSLDAVPQKRNGGPISTAYWNFAAVDRDNAPLFDESNFSGLESYDTSDSLNYQDLDEKLAKQLQDEWNKVADVRAPDLSYTEQLIGESPAAASEPFSSNVEDSSHFVTTGALDPDERLTHFAGGDEYTEIFEDEPLYETSSRPSRYDDAPSSIRLPESINADVDNDVEFLAEYPLAYPHLGSYSGGSDINVAADSNVSRIPEVHDIDNGTDFVFSDDPDDAMLQAAIEKSYIDM